eukprot:8089606-Pyramimonas_sp.AAC.1
MPVVVNPREATEGRYVSEYRGVERVPPTSRFWLKAIGSRVHATSTAAFTSQGARGDGCPGGM